MKDRSLEEISGGELTAFQRERWELNEQFIAWEKLPTTQMMFAEAREGARDLLKSILMIPKTKTAILEREQRMGEMKAVLWPIAFMEAQFRKLRQDFETGEQSSDLNKLIQEELANVEQQLTDSDFDDIS